MYINMYIHIYVYVCLYLRVYLSIQLSTRGPNKPTRVLEGKTRNPTGLLLRNLI